MGNIKVYKGKMSKELYFVGCRTALRVVRGIDIQGKRQCGAAGCACAADEPGFSVASEEETEGFVRTTGTVASDSLS